MTAREPGRCLAAISVCLALGLVATGCGCGKRQGKWGSVDQLRQTRLRYAVEERKATCYITAEVENTGELPVREVVVTATLSSKSGKRRWYNTATLRDVRPHEKRTFYMTVGTHGSFHRAELTFGEPGKRG
jgi:hypothetical protein